MNKKILLVMLAVALVLGMTLVGCKDAGGGGSSGGAKSITITGLPSGYHDEVDIEIFSDDDFIAYGYIEDEFTGTSATVPLYEWDDYSGDEKPWTGSGSYYIYLELDDDEYFTQKVKHLLRLV
jgi:hypothetical protein